MTPFCHLEGFKDSENLSTEVPDRLGTQNVLYVLTSYIFIDSIVYICKNLELKRLSPFLLHRSPSISTAYPKD